MSTKKVSKEKIINDLLELRKEELSKIIGGTAACVPGCSGVPIGCGPGYCTGPCPSACLSNCMVNPSCSFQN